MRRIFISYQHRDHKKAQGFNLLQWNKNVELEVSTRHMLSTVDSENRPYISTKIREQLTGTSVTVVLIGRETHQSDWVADEIRWSQEKGNGLVGICLEPSVTVPAGLNDCGAEILSWDPHAFNDAIERAALAAGRAVSIAASASSGSGSCSR
jgi:hypothetical protein